MPGKRYRVTGVQPVLGNQPGSSFEADLPANQEKALLSGGAIEVVERQEQATGTPPTTPIPTADASGDTKKKEGR